MDNPLEECQSQLAELQRFQANLTAAVADLQRSNATLAESNQELQRANTELNAINQAIIVGLAYAIDLRDEETEGRTQQVAELTVKLGQAMHLADKELENLRIGALLHDIGKLGIPEEILLKPGKLTQEEWTLVRQHPDLAYRLLSTVSALMPVMDIPYCHHEKWDGSGYPRGLKAEQIPLAARIFAVVDVYEALCSERPYRHAWPASKVRDYILAEAGRHFDPQIVNVFLSTREFFP